MLALFIPWYAPIKDTFTISLTEHPLDKSCIGFLNPWSNGPIALYPPIRSVILYAIFPASKLGYIKTFALPFKTDFGYFSTSDQNESVNRSNPVFDITAEGDTIVLHPYPYFGDSGTEFPIEFQESAEYTQLNIQLEYDLPWDIQFFGQYFENNILEYQAEELGINDPICMTNLCIDPEEFKPENIFTPGMGAPTGALSDQSIMLNLEKSFS